MSINGTHIYVKDLGDGRTRKFISQYDADRYYNKRLGYFKDIKTVLNGENKKYKVIEAAKIEEVKRW